LTGLKPNSRVRWGMITTGVPSDLDKNPLVLHQNGEQLTLTIIAPGKAAWNQIDTATPRHEWDSPNPGTRMVAFETRAPKSGQLTLAVVATPGTCRAPLALKAKIEPLEDWGRKN
jgi:hypothetical protein